jgi:hypothetical protein
MAKQKLLERNGKRWSYCHGTPATCLLHMHDAIASKPLDMTLDEQDIHYFNQDVTHIDYEKMSLDFANKLNAEELRAIAHYADSGYKPINLSLIKGEDIKPEYINAIDSTIAKALPVDKTVYRGIKNNFPYKVGDTVKFPMYLSTSFNPHKAVEFTEKENPTILLFQTKQGAPISLVHKEMEIVLPRDSEFTLTEVVTTDFTCVYPDTDYTVSYPNATIYILTQ